MKNKTQQIFQSHWLTYFLAVALLTFAFRISAGGKEPPPPLQIKHSANGNVNNPVYIPESRSVEKSEHVKILEKQLDAARTSNNTSLAREIQSNLNILLGQKEVHEPMTELTNKHITTEEKQGHEEHELDYFLSPIHNYSIYSHALGVAPSNSPIAGRLFYLISQDSQNGSDTLKLIYSTNNGASWLTDTYMSLAGITFNKDEMDIEIVYNGTETWLFAVIGITAQSDSRKKVIFYRRNISTNATYWTTLNFPGSGADMHYYNPRITSDNANYTANCFVMMICSMDSLAGSTHYIKQKYVYSSTPFDAVPGFNYAQPSGTNGFYWTTNVGTTGNAYLYGDIAYYKDEGGTGENRIMTVYNCYKSGFNNIYIAYLQNYSSIGGNLVVTEPNVNKNLSIAFNGGANNRNGLITYVREFSSSDWDIFGLRTTNGGINGAAWVRDTIDYSNNYARSCDISAVRGGNAQFRITYAMDNSNVPTAFFKSFNGSSWSNRIIFSNNAIDTVYAKPRAGYILGSADDGAGVWSSYNGYNGFFSKHMLTTTGISSNNEIPSGFSLSQNYPNPFNPVTNIKFSIPVNGLVTLKIYDISGKEVAALVNQNMNAGSYTFDFDASNLSSGAYFYRLSANGFTDVKKMMLVK